ncbi:kinesin-like protein KIN-6 [Vicia villosa]|uniref:kinesin-like protein KIN-6 n=1 Tax=Vicia villosa TaxID=3911 RepID=UPI00273BD01D|nr:kinesin-like protein KIN-6 [Vicia villosa]
MSTTKMNNSTAKSCPYTVTVRRNPPRRARATPSHGITPFPNEEILSEQISKFPAATSEDDEIPKNPSTSENENPINPTPSENENLKVFLRIRPSQPPNQAPRVRAKTAWPKNQTKNVTNNLKKKSSSSCISINDSQSVTLLVPSDLQDAKRVKSETYGGFTHVFPSDSSQLEVYERMVKPMAEEFTKGKSGMLAALGPSGSGKTHTVFGTPRDPGMVPLVLGHIFKETEASRSYYIAIFEIYTERGKSEKLFDLLPDGSELSMQQSTIKGQKEVLISNAEQAESLIAQAVIKRATAMTNTNSQSSRSQCIINIRDGPKKGKGVVNSKSNNAVLTIIDLAGAEREKRTGNQGTRLVESNFINNTLMVFGLCLRSLLEHQKNPKKQLQKHFQNSMLTRYLRDYLEGKKRMTLLLTAKSGEDDYLDTSHLLRQASPYMQIKYNEVEPSINMVPKKRNHQASSIIDSAKQSPSLAHLKRMKLVSEHTVQAGKGVEECHTSKKVSKFDASSSVPEKGVEECNTSKKDTSTVSKFNASSSIPEKGVEECNTSKKDTSVSKFDASCAVPEKGVEECNTSKKDASTVSKFDASSSVTLKSECNSHVGSERNHIIMRNFARVIWNVLKQYNSKIKVAESEILSLKESIGYEKERNLELETQLNAFRAACTCCKGGNEKTNIEDGSLVDLDHLHDLDQEETFEAESPSEPRIDLSDEEHILGTTSTMFDSKKSERKVSVSSSKSGHHNALEADDESKDTFHAQPSSEPILNVSNEEPTVFSEPILNVSNEEPIVSSHTLLDSEKSDREVSVSWSMPVCHNDLEVDAMCKISSEIFHSESSPEPSNEEHMLGSSCTVLEPEKSDREVSESLSNSGIHEAFEVNAVRTVPNETLNAESPSKSRIDQLGEEHMLGSTCTKLDSEIPDREVSVSSSKPGHGNSLEVDAETLNAESPSKPRIDQLGEEHMLGSTCTKLDSEIPDREVSVSLSKPGDDNSLEVDAETLNSESPSKSRIDQLGEEHMLGSTCTKLDSEIPDREISVSSSKHGHDNSLEVDTEMLNAKSPSKPIIDPLSEERMLDSTCTELDSEIPDREVSISSSKPGLDNSLEVDAETFHAQTSSEPMTGPGRQLHMENSNSLVLDVLASSSKPEDHKDLVVEAKSKIPSELLDSSLSTKDGILDPSLPKDVSSTETQKDKVVSNSCKPPRSKRTLMPSSSILSRNLSTFDLFDESEKSKENRGTRKLGARDDPKRSNGSISLLHMLHGAPHAPW